MTFFVAAAAWDKGCVSYAKGDKKGSTEETKTPWCASHVLLQHVYSHVIYSLCKILIYLVLFFNFRGGRKEKMEEPTRQIQKGAACRETAAARFCAGHKGAVEIHAFVTLPGAIPPRPTVFITSGH